MPDSFNFSDLTNDQVTELAVNFERQRYALQMEIGRREIGWLVDEVMARYFRIGKLVMDGPGSLKATRLVKEMTEEDFADFC